MDYRVSRIELAAMVEGSVRELPAADHRQLHRKLATSRGGGARGPSDARAYGRPYFSMLARFRWGRVEVEALIGYRETVR